MTNRLRRHLINTSKQQRAHSKLERTTGERGNAHSLSGLGPF